MQAVGLVWQAARQVDWIVDGSQHWYLDDLALRSKLLAGVSSFLRQ